MKSVIELPTGSGSTEAAAAFFAGLKVRFQFLWWRIAPAVFLSAGELPTTVTKL